MSENDIVDSGIPLPRMATVQPLPDYVLKVKWAEGPRAGREDLVNVSPAIFSYKVYRPLRDESLFLMGAIAEDGDAVTWGSEDLMMSADTIQSLAQESWTPKEFVNFLNRNKLTQEAAAALLGRIRRQIATYVMTGPIPRVVALACYGLESLRRDRFVSGDGNNIGAQPPTICADPAAERSEQDCSPAPRTTPRQRALS
jgi:hypothetical protein